MLEIFVVYNVYLQIDVGFDVIDDQFLQCIFYVGNCYVMVFVVVDQFIDYGVIVWWYGVIGVNM